MLLVLDMAAIWIYPEGIVIELAEVTKSPVLKLLGLSFSASHFTCAAVNQVLSALALS